MNAAQNGPGDLTPQVRAFVELVTKRLDDLREAENKRIDELAKLRATHVMELSDAEAKRIDANRMVNRAAVALDNERAIRAAGEEVWIEIKNSEEKTA